MDAPRNILILGSGGIGSALACELAERFPASNIVLTYRSKKPQLGVTNIHYYYCDALEEKQHVSLMESMKRDLGFVDWIINTIGLLHDHSKNLVPEKRLQDFDAENFQYVLATNVLPTVYAAKNLSTLYVKDRQCLFASISARVGSITDNRLGGWHSYRSSKSCLNMMLKNISIEWAYRYPNVCVLALHPGTTDSELSKPFQKNVPSGKLFSSSQCAKYLIDVMLNKQASDSGRFLDWNDESVLW